MPIYEYFCSDCRRVFEIRLSFSQSNSTALCPWCNTPARKLISSFAARTGSYLQATEKPFGTSAWEEPKP